MPARTALLQFAISLAAGVVAALVVRELFAPECAGALLQPAAQGQSEV